MKWTKTLCCCRLLRKVVNNMGPCPRICSTIWLQLIQKQCLTTDVVELYHVSAESFSGFQEIKENPSRWFKWRVDNVECGLQSQLIIQPFWMSWLHIFMSRILKHCITQNTQIFHTVRNWISTNFGFLKNQNHL